MALLPSGRKDLTTQMSIATSAATGPRTPEGKAVSSRNAIRHGLTSVAPLLPSEDPAEFERFQSNLITQYDPQDCEDTVIVAAYVDTLWRLRRVPVHEAKLIGIELVRMKLSAQDDKPLQTLLSALDPESLETLALERLSKTLLNLHRQEARLNRKLKDLAPDLERIMHQSKVRYIEHLKQQKSQQDTRMRTQQNELVQPQAAESAAGRAADNPTPATPILRRIA
jgi:hypothetical protein